MRVEEIWHFLSQEFRVIADLPMQDQVSQSLLCLLRLPFVFSSIFRCCFCLHCRRERELFLNLEMNGLLEGRHRARVVLDDFRGKLLQNLLLRPSQNKGCDAPFQTLQSVNESLSFLEVFRHFFHVSSEVLVVHFVENGFFFEEIGHQKIEKRPQLSHSILQRCS